jgi:hypothetical protein
LKTLSAILSSIKLTVLPSPIIRTQVKKSEVKVLIKLLNGVHILADRIAMAVAPHKSESLLCYYYNDNDNSC